ncbi:hypothetical protein ACFCZ3_19945 [Cellulosimicrobium cellulans]|uniref:hypothetical protein n=1 Tax=Cellulosimicrobium cellulans TaxID=1710 RepID=UPI0035E36895
MLAGAEDAVAAGQADAVADELAQDAGVVGGEPAGPLVRAQRDAHVALAHRGVHHLVVGRDALRHGPPPR